MWEIRDHFFMPGVLKGLESRAPPDGVSWDHSGGSLRLIGPTLKLREFRETFMAYVLQEFNDEGPTLLAFEASRFRAIPLGEPGADRVRAVPPRPGGGCRWPGRTGLFDARHVGRRFHEATCEHRPDGWLPDLELRPGRERAFLKVIDGRIVLARSASCS